MRWTPFLLLAACAGAPPADEPVVTPIEDTGDPTDSGEDSAAPLELACSTTTTAGWTGSQELPEVETLTATASGGDDSQELEYRWTWTAQPSPFAPATGSLEIGTWAGEAQAEVHPFFSGDYSLLVEARQGTEETSCTTTVTVERTGLTIELVPTEANGDDFDLHVLRPGGTLYTSDDCYFFTCQDTGPDWGVLGTQDDPVLWARGNGAGTDEGSIEMDIFSLQEPEIGTYDIYVNDYAGSPVNEPTSFRVRIWHDTQMLGEFERTVTGDDTNTLVASIAWPTLVVTEATR